MSTTSQQVVDPGRSLVDVLSARAREQPRDLAYAFLSEGESVGARLSYGLLDRTSRAIASAVSDQAVAGDRALLLYPPGLGFIGAFFACLRAGIVAVPVPCDPGRELKTRLGLRAVLRDARPRLVLTEAGLLPFIEKLGEELPELRSVCPLATDRIDLNEAASWRQPPVAASDLAYLQYTSGSTSAPRGVEISHRNVLWNSAAIRRAWGYGGDSIAVMWVPHFHDDGLVHGIVQPLFSGFPSYLMGARELVRKPVRWPRAISRWRATHSGGPNFAYALCAGRTTAEERADLDLSSWRVAYNAAEPIHRETLDRFVDTFGPRGFRRQAFFPSYGLAEATLLVSTKTPRTAPRLCAVERDALALDHRFRPVSDQRPGCKTVVGCGRVVDGAQVAIVDPEKLTRCDADQVGEVWIAGPGVARGYWRRREDTARTFEAYLAGTGEGPFLRTGDLAFVDRGELFITGRLKDLIIIRGRNHYPQDIELTVADADADLRPGCGAAFAVERDGEEALAVVQEVSERRQLDFAEILQRVSGAVTEAHDLALDTLVLVRPKTIPKTSSGKIQRHACRAALESGALHEVASWSASRMARESGAGSEAVAAEAPGVGRGSRAIEDWLIAWTAAETGVEAAAIELNRSFASLGLDSVTGVWLVGDLQAWLGRAVDSTLVWDYPTIETMAAHLAREEAIEGA